MSAVPARWPEPRHSAVELSALLGTPTPTEEQRLVIEAAPMPAVVVAGAGSGKTETMAARVIWLVANGFVEPQDVLGLTFTRKAALELGARLTGKLRQLRDAGVVSAGREEGDAGRSDAFDLPTISTYHAYAGRLVAEHGLRLGVEPDAVLLSEAACWQIAHDVVHSYEGEMPGMTAAASTVVRAVLALSGELGEHLVEPSEAVAYLSRLADRLEDLPHEGRPLKVGAATAEDLRVQTLVYPLVERYRQAKAARGALDFGDQMALAARLARDVPDVGTGERTRFRAVLLDEFQDTSEAQMVLLTSLFGGHPLPVTAVGDPHQSIYGWRGASATTLTRFPQEFAVDGATAPVLQLSTSWRNTQRVLEAANAVAAPLREATLVPVSTLRPRPDAGQGSVEAARLLDTGEEAEHVAEWVHHQWQDPRVRTAAVLCRARAQFPVIVEALRRRGLPVEVVGLGGLLDTPEILDLVAVMWVAQEPTRGDQVMRLLTGPVCRLGAADVDALWAWAREQARDPRDGTPTEHEHAAVLAEVLDHLPPRGWVGREGQVVSPVVANRVAWLARVVRRVRSLTGLPLADLVVETERMLGLDIEVASDPDLHPAWGRAPLDALAEVAAGFSSGADRPTLGGFLSWLDAAREHERGLEDAPHEVPELAAVDVDRGAVQVLTVHAAKGLEWDAVAVPGLAEGTFPSVRAVAKAVEGGWQVPEPAERGWLAGVGKLPTELRGDRLGRPDVAWWTVPDTRRLRSELEEVALERGRFSVQEERRLAYVAFTRARDRVLLTVPVWSTGLRPRVTSRFLLEALGSGAVDEGVWVPMPDPDEPDQCVNPRAADAASADWPLEPGARREAVRGVAAALLTSGVAAPEGQVALPLALDPWDRTLELLLAEREERRRVPRDPDIPEHLSTSALVELAADPVSFRRRLRRPLPSAPAPHARTGTAFHAWVEAHYSSASLVDLHEVDGADGWEATADMERLQQAFLDSEWADRTPLEVEVALETTLAGRTVRGRIDAVFPDPDGGVTVVDWKTGAPGTPQQQRTRSWQLAVYRLAYARLTGRDPALVRAAFFYARTGQTVRPDLPDDEELEALVTEVVGGHDEEG
ncbi:ATP-dependent helicase [Ornithinimicrobium flavum]|uniref:ATP-dependent helicase n=1 Tax=Ornithinimicrobium flavum TaxID=1288636 RepID=UPI001EE8A18C|nr:ATP-dependent DNA helicase [Ornithinimicrobium flavum]